MGTVLFRSGPSCNSRGMPLRLTAVALAIVAAFGSLVASALLPSPGAAKAATARKDFLSFERDGSIYLASLDGRPTSLILRATAGVSYSEPAWSKDGRRLAVTATEVVDEGRGYVNVVLALPKPPERIICCDPLNGEPSWAPDGRNLVFAGYQFAEPLL